MATFFPHCKKVCIDDIYAAYEHLMGWEKKEDKVSDEKNRVQGTKNEVVEAPPEEEPMDTLTPLLEHLKMAVSLIDYNIKSLEQENISGIIAAMQILKMANISLQADFQSLLDMFGYNRGFRK